MKRRRLIYEVFESRRLLAGTALNLPDNVSSIAGTFRDVYVNQFGDATISESIDPASQKDGYALFRNERNIIVGGRADATDALDLEMAAYSDQTSDVILSDDDTNGLNPQIGGLNLVNAIPVWLLVGERQEDDTGAYTFTAEGPDHTATQLSFSDQRISGSGNIAGQVDYDFFEFTTPKAGGYDISVTPGSGLDVTFNLYDSAGVPVVGTFLSPRDQRGTDGNEEISVTLNGNESYFLRVDGFDRSSGDFEFTINATKLPDNVSSIAGTFRDVYVNQFGDATISESIDPASQKDGYALFRNERNIIVSGRADATDPLDLEMAAYSDQTSDVILTVDDTNGLNPQIGGLNLVNAIPVWLLVGERQEDDTGAYTFIAEGPDHATTELFFRDGESTASGNISDQVDYDFFEFIVPQTGVYRIEVNPVGGLDATFNAYDAQGTPVIGNFLTPVDNSFGIESALATFRRGEKVFLRVDGFGGSTGDFDVLIDPQFNLQYTSVVGVDFGDRGSRPDRWGRVSSFSAVGSTFGNLVDEAGNTTPFELTLSGSTNGQSFDVAIDSDTLPAHSRPLGGIDNIVFPSDDQGPMQAVWSGLEPGSPYEVYVFGADVETNTQRVTITGGGVSTSFVQTLGAQELFINGEVGQSTRELPSYADVVLADQDGKITINVEKLSGVSLSLAGLAIRQLTGELDFGDAPTAAQSGLAGDYPVSLAQDGARHAISSLFLGASIDEELDGRPDGQAGQGVTGGDDNHEQSDEDGVFVLANIVANPASPTGSSFLVTSTGNGKLDGWIDFNQDGDWNDASEQIFTSVDVVPGNNVLSYTIPAAAVAGATGARFRLSTAGGLGVVGAAADGEVEDYIAEIEPAVDNAIEISSASSGTVSVSIDGADLRVLANTVELFRGPSASISSFEHVGTSGDDTLAVATGMPVLGSGLGFAGGLGTDALRLIASDQEIDLTGLSESAMTGVETIDIAGTGANALTVSENNVMTLPDLGSTLTVVMDGDDVLNVADGDFLITGSTVNEGRFQVIAESTNALFRVDGLGWTNPLNRLDINASGEITAGDALNVVNQLNVRSFVTSDLTTLVDPTSLSEFPLRFFDATGDGKLSALDALRVINFLGRGNVAQPEFRLPLVSLESNFSHGHLGNQAESWERPETAVTLVAPRFEPVKDAIFSDPEISDSEFSEYPSIENLPVRETWDESVDRVLGEFFDQELLAGQ